MSEERYVCYDEQLQIEAYQFIGLMQKFPNHFHEYYVIGFIEKGKRHLSCKNKSYDIMPGDLLLFNPRDNHTCEQIDEETLDYRCLNVMPEVMEKVVGELGERTYRPYFTCNVVPCCQQVEELKAVHQMIMNGEQGMIKEEAFYFLLEQLIRRYARPMEEGKEKVKEEIERVCTYMDEHFEEQLTLGTICEIAGLKKYTLLRSFTAQKGVTPFQYLETIRIGHAKKLLEQNVAVSEVALWSGFSDQSHFTRFFKNYIGLTPKQYQNIFKGSEKDDGHTGK